MCRYISSKSEVLVEVRHIEAVQPNQRHGLSWVLEAVHPLNLTTGSDTFHYITSMLFVF